MVTMTVERVVRAPVDEVFDWLADPGNYPTSRVVLRARLVTTGAGTPHGTGAVRVLLWFMGWFRERITAYERPRRFDYLVERSVPPVRHEGGSLTFTEVAGGTRVVWTTTAVAALPFAADVVTRRVAAPVITWAFGRVLAAADSALAR
ncbi:SRPBCC family protein [Pseudonocardia sp. CA-107938]|uniref:SRPBCC family protein n=1 Tax=Pseudonocardia sp. CA-107938 TaxID=3240021 RepID=UPI003D929739